MIQDHKGRSAVILSDLIEYVKQPELIVRHRCKYAMIELAYQWQQYKDNPLEFYRSTDFYIFDLTLYQSMLVPDVNYMVDMAKMYGMKKILDLGGGIGEYSIRFMQEIDGAEVTYLELKDSQTRAYAEHRFKKHKVTPIVVDENYDWQSQEWDAVIAMDVLEHMEEATAMKTLEAMRAKAKFVYANPEKLEYNVLYPQHITRYNLDGFDKMDLNLYSNTRLT